MKMTSSALASQLETTTPEEINSEIVFGPLNMADNKRSDDLRHKLLESGEVTVNFRNQSISPLSHPSPKRTDTVYEAEELFFEMEDSSVDATCGDIYTPSTDKADISTTREDSVETVKQSHISKDKENEQLMKNVSPSDSDSFDWRQHVSPLVIKTKSKRRSSFGVLKKNATESPEVFSVALSTSARKTPELPIVGRQQVTFSPQMNATPSLSAVSPSPAFGRKTRTLLYQPSFLTTVCEESDVPDQSVKDIKSRLTYDQRITPFRNLFETLPKLRQENQALKEENSRLAASLAESENKVAESISDLQSQMTTALKFAVEKAERLQQELNASEIKNQELQKLLSSKTNSAVDPK